MRSVMLSPSGTPTTTSDLDRHAPIKQVAYPASERLAELSQRRVQTRCGAFSVRGLRPRAEVPMWDFLSATNV